MSSPSVAMGYRGDRSDQGTSTRFADAGVLHTGDAGFCYAGQVFVLGRMGSALKVRGRSVFMEAVETRLAAATGIPKGKFCAVAHSGVGLPGIALFVETSAGSWVGTARRLLRSDLGPAPTVQIVIGPRGFIRRTSSGKPRREKMWALLVAGDLVEGTVIDDETITADNEQASAPTPTSWGHRPANIQELLAKTLDAVDVDDAATILLEGSLAEGFGNDASDVDFLAVVPGDATTPTMPTVLFIDGRRTEMRTRSIGQLRGQLDTTRAVFTDSDADLLERPGNDTLNRCQRFLRAVVVRPGNDVEQVLQVRSSVPYREFTGWMRRWWLSRARQSLRQAVAFEAFGARADARAWARDGLQQAAKGWIAGCGEAYLETKWLSLQMDRSGESVAVARYRELDAALGEAAAGGAVDRLDEAIAMAAQFGVTDVANDPAAVIFARVPGVTTWPIGQVLHVIRGDQDVFALTGEAATAWRSVVFGRPVSEAVAQCGRGSLLAEFVRLGLVSLRWRDEAAIRPAIALCEPAQPYTCPPCGKMPAVRIGGSAANYRQAPIRLAARSSRVAPTPSSRWPTTPRMRAPSQRAQPHCSSWPDSQVTMDPPMNAGAIPVSRTIIYAGQRRFLSLGCRCVPDTCQKGGVGSRRARSRQGKSRPSSVQRVPKLVRGETCFMVGRTGPASLARRRAAPQPAGSLSTRLLSPSVT